MARPKCLMRNFTNLNRIYKAHQTNVWGTMEVFRIHCKTSVRLGTHERHPSTCSQVNYAHELWGILHKFLWEKWQSALYLISSSPPLYYSPTWNNEMDLASIHTGPAEFHWKLKFVTLATLSSLMAPEVVIMRASGWHYEDAPFQVFQLASGQWNISEALHCHVYCTIDAW